ncbi:putative F-box protein AUF1 [Dioscorea sansibarensis]
MEELPSHLLVDILSRLADSTDLARCRLACSTLRSLSYGVTAVHVTCSPDRFLRSRNPATADDLVPFKSLVANLASLLSSSLLSLCLSVHHPPSASGEDDPDESDDFHLTAVDFLSQWIPVLASRLTSLSISDYWIQSCWRRSLALGFISDHCGNLLCLELKNAWLSVEHLKPMLKLTALTLEFVRLEDENLNKLNAGFPSLQGLKLIMVGGLKNPKISLPHLRVCHWTVSNYPHSLTIDAPELIELNLTCVEPRSLVLKTPSLLKLNLEIKKPSGIIQFGGLLNLESLRMVTSDLQILMQLFKGCKAVRKLELDAPEYSDKCTTKTFTFEDLLISFPCMDDLKLGPCIINNCFEPQCLRMPVECRKLKHLEVHLPPFDLDFSFMACMLSFCLPNCLVAILIHADVSTIDRTHFVSKCSSSFPRMRWKWGMWK